MNEQHDDDQVGPSRGWVRRLWDYLGRYRRNLVITLVASIVGTLMTVLTPLVARRVVDQVIVAHTGQLAPFVVVLLLIGVVRFASGYLRRYLGGRLSLDVQHDMRTDVFEALSRLDGAKQDDLATGQVVSRANSDIMLVQGLLGFMPMMLGSALLFVLSLGTMAVLSPLLTLVALVVAPALLLVAMRSRSTVFPASWEAQQLAGVVAGIVEEDVTGVRVVKGFGQEQREIRRLDAGVRELFAARMRSVRMTSRITPTMQSLPALGQVGILALGGWLALRGHLSLGTFLAFSAYLSQLLGPVRMFAGVITIGQQARAGVIRVLEVIDSQPVIRERPDATELRDVRGLVELDDVSFGYSRSTPVLSGVNLRIEPGETMAFVGAAGSGKSTISLLIPRFYDVHGGAVRIDGQDVRSLTISSLRAALGVVFEEPFLFSDTVRANIGYGRPDATDEQIEAAARAAEADEFIQALPDGYQTVVGERGLTLSGGQRQRVALARALLTDPRVLLLDDATSAVDPAVEAEIHATLRTLARGRTTLLVAHRRSTLHLADRICVLDAGRVVDVGTHEELTERCARYRLLLSGPGEDAEGVDAGQLDLADEEPAVPGQHALTLEVNGVTPSLWRYDAAPSAASVTSRPKASVGRPGGMAAGGYGGALAALPATPELLARVAALPPATDEPAVSVVEASKPDPGFSLGRLLRPLRRPFGLGLLLVALDALAGLALPALIRHGIDAGVTRHASQVLFGTAAVGLLIVLADWAVSTGEQRVTGRTGERLLYTLRIKTFAQLQRLGLDYYEHEMAGRIMTRMTTDIDALSTFLQTGLVNAVVSLLSFVGVLVALFLLDAGLALTVLLVVPVLAVATVLFRSRATRAYTDAREKISTVNASLQENVSGMRVAQAYNRERRNASSFRELGEDYRSSRMRAQRLVATYFPFIEFLSEVATALVIGVGARRVTHGDLTPGALIAFLLYVDLFFSPLQQLSQVFDGYQQAAVGLRRLRDLMRTPTSTPPAPDPVLPGRLRGELVCADVRFRYTGAERDALAGVSLSVAPGETVALVGATGAGKSSLVKLLARFYDVTEGQVLVDGVDVRQYDLTAFRQRLGVVPQEPFLFAGTVRDNIAYGRPDASDAEVEAAARRVGAHAVVARLPAGYLAAVGERGRSLSAGQRQLIALARAELVDPDVLLLDEATAALDLESEAAYVRATEELTRRRTTVLVAHRLSTAARADRVIVLSDGLVVQSGSHAELLAEGGEYARLWAAFEGVRQSV
jgi:ATP-binding cassette subfamily B protein